MIHVVCNGRWKVYRKGATKSIKSTKDRQEAIEYANKIAQEILGQLIVHHKNGAIDFTLDYTVPKKT